MQTQRACRRKDGDCPSHTNRDRTWRDLSTLVHQAHQAVAILEFPRDPKIKGRGGYRLILVHDPRPGAVSSLSQGFLSPLERLHST